jgi:drug/metabolite transporter (DMT)-like permease
LDVSAQAVATKSREKVGLAYGLLAALIWGGYVTITHCGITMGLTPFDLAVLRYGTAGLLMVPWLVRNSPRDLGGVGWPKAIFLALMAGPAFVLVGSSGFLFAPLAHGALFQLGSLTLLGILLSAFLVGEGVGRQRFAGMGIVIVGLGVMAGPELLSGGSSALLGDFLFICAGAMWALFTVLQRRWRINPVAATAAVSVVSAAVYAPVYLIWHGPSNLFAIPGWVLGLQIVVAGLLSGVVALFAFSRAAEYLGPGRASLFPALAPAIAILLGIPISNIYPTGMQLLGLAVLSVGLVLAARQSGGHHPDSFSSQSALSANR